MTLESALNEITIRLRQGRFPNEQAVSQGIVLRVLSELGWNTWDTNIVWPEYQTGEGRVDFALCNPASKPAIFIEVKQPGKAEIGVKQALEYAFHTGVPFIVLTDGKTWSFYLPAEQGSYEDRRVYKLDLFERPANEAVDILIRYMAHSRVESGEAIEIARKEYRNHNRRAQARAAIPDAWSELVEKGDELLIDILASAVESKAGIRPDDEDVIDYLSSLSKTDTGILIYPPPPPAIGPIKPNKPHPKGPLIIQGQTYFHKNAKEAMVIVLRELAKADPSFLLRCSKHPDAQGSKRCYIARKAEDLYPDRTDLWDKHEILRDGWLVATNLNNNIKKNIIRLASDVAGLTFGKDIIVEF